jgi:hypothetical protein
MSSLVPTPSVSVPTRDRRRLINTIETRGAVMVYKCTFCRESKKPQVCKVHISSGRCSACIKNSKKCDVRVAEREWDKIQARRKELMKSIEESRQKVNDMNEEMNKALSKEMRLRKELDLLDSRDNAEASVAARLLEEEEAALEAATVEPLPFDPSDPLALSPFTWSAMEGLPDDFWSAPLPDYLAESS